MRHIYNRHASYLQQTRVISTTDTRLFACRSCVSYASRHEVTSDSCQIKITTLYLEPEWPRGLRRGSAATRLLGLWVPIPPGAWMSVSCECCVLSGRGLCVGLITRPEESYRLCVCLVVWDLETSTTSRPRPELGCCVTGNKKPRTLRLPHGCRNKVTSE
jgi:hypothetical protein